MKTGEDLVPVVSTKGLLMFILLFLFIKEKFGIVLY